MQGKQPRLPFGQKQQSPLEARHAIKPDSTLPTEARNEIHDAA
jgi:hypothetical protein